MNLLTGIVDIEYSLIYYLDYQCIRIYGQLSKFHNEFLKKHIVYKLLLEYNKYLHFPKRKLIDWASENNYIEILNWSQSSKSKLEYTENALDLASNNGHIKVLEW